MLRLYTETTNEWIKQQAEDEPNRFLQLQLGWMTTLQFWSFEFYAMAVRRHEEEHSTEQP